jgi:lycopene beta-cyclase
MRLADSTNTSSKLADYVLVGGGLQSGLMALAIRHHRPEARIVILERESKLAGNHTWSFHASDIPANCHSWASPLIESRWPGYQIIVGGRTRQVNMSYVTCSSEHFAAVITERFRDGNCQVLTDTIATDITENSVRLANGTLITATAVIDNCGPSRLDLASFSGGFQKFWGFEIELTNDWPFENPIVMDDRVDQTDGFRFIYTLPMERRRVLVEDTRFSNTSTIDRDECFQQVTDYLKARNCGDYRIVREENGVLPMPTTGFMPGNPLPHLAGGYRGGWFHAATGYSFPLAIQLAELVATTPVDKLAEAMEQLKQQNTGRARFARFLNRLLFELVKPHTRYQIFRRFYRVLDEPAIARFYGHRFTWSDAFRIVVGFPPGGLRPLNFVRSFRKSKLKPANYPSVVSKKVPA